MSDEPNRDDVPTDDGADADPTEPEHMKRADVANGEGDPEDTEEG